MTRVLHQVSPKEQIGEITHWVRTGAVASYQGRELLQQSYTYQYPELCERRRMGCSRGSYGDASLAVQHISSFLLVTGIVGESRKKM
jgi:hypothetical protein